MSKGMREDAPKGMGADAPWPPPLYRGPASERADHLTLPLVQVSETSLREIQSVIIQPLGRLSSSLLLLAPGGKRGRGTRPEAGRVKSCASKVSDGVRNQGRVKL